MEKRIVILVALVAMFFNLNSVMAQEAVADPCPDSKISVIRTGPGSYTRVCADPATPEGIRIASRGAVNLTGPAGYFVGNAPIYYAGQPDPSASYARTYMTTTVWDMQESVLVGIEATALSQEVRNARDRAHAQGQLLILGNQIGELQGSVTQLSGQLFESQRALAAAISAGDEANRQAIETEIRSLQTRIETAKKAQVGQKNDSKDKVEEHTTTNEPKSASEAKQIILQGVDKRSGGWKD
ncbi:hypothetical protein HYW18_00490 [Candidatus Uhrbacteria bacterium]|nr:hypothetical protein [Candidatus Uhrbacteria bacterium]